MDLVTKESEVLVNIETLKQYLHGSGIDRDFVLDLLRLGICFVVTEANTAPFFAPSRFIGYQSNTRHDHLHNDDKDGRETNAALEALLHSAPTPSDVLERQYEHFCTNLVLLCQIRGFVPDLMEIEVNSLVRRSPFLYADARCGCRAMHRLGSIV